MKIALLSDIHISSHAAEIVREQCPVTNLREALAEILKEKPDRLLINGDCAQRVGLQESYAALQSHLQPFQEAGIPIHLLPGNHDNPQAMGMDPKKLEVLDLDHARFVLLRTPIVNSIVPGRIGQRQFAEVQRAVEATEKPVILFGHHNPEQPHRTDCDHGIGLLDTALFQDFLAASPQIKAYVFGHTHSWHVEQAHSTHLVNLPSTAFTFRKGPVRGWVLATLSEDALHLELRPLPSSPEQAGTVRLTLRW